MALHCEQLAPLTKKPVSEQPPQLALLKRKVLAGQEVQVVAEEVQFAQLLLQGEQSEPLIQKPATAQRVQVLFAYLKLPAAHDVQFVAVPVQPAQEASH